MKKRKLQTIQLKMTTFPKLFKWKYTKANINLLSVRNKRLALRITMYERDFLTRKEPMYKTPTIFLYNDIERVCVSVRSLCLYYVSTHLIS